jgi:tetratricopeptide (TPR) repeat protein
LATKSVRVKPFPKKVAAQKAPPRKAVKSAPVSKAKPAAKPAAKAAAKRAVKPATKATGSARSVAKKVLPAKPARRPAEKVTAKKPAKKAVVIAKPKPAAKSKPVKAPVPVKPVAKKTPAKLTVTAKAKTPAPKVAPVTPARKRQPIPVSAPPIPVKPTAAKIPPRQPSQDEAAALRLFESARREFALGRFSDARTQFRSLVDKYPGISEIAARARTYLTITETRLRAEASLPRDADSLYDRGVIELNRGDFVAAQEMFERALKKEPGAAHIFYGLAATRARLGALESALESLQRALDLQPNLRVRAQHDHDLQPLRNEPEFENLVFGGRP